MTVTGLEFQAKNLGASWPYAFRFSCQHKYFSGKCEKLVACEKNLVILATRIDEKTELMNLKSHCHLR